MRKSYDEEQDQIRAAVATFPATFTLPVFGSRPCRVAPLNANGIGAHFVLDGDVQIVVQVLNGDQWQDAGRDTATAVHSRAVCGDPGGIGVYCDRPAGHDGPHGDRHESWTTLGGRACGVCGGAGVGLDATHCPYCQRPLRATSGAQAVQA